MEEWEKIDGGGAALMYFKQCIEQLCKKHGVRVPDDEGIKFFYFKRYYSVVDVIRMETKDLKIKEAKVSIEWKDQYGLGSKDFYNSKDIREFLQSFQALREYLGKNSR